MASPDAPSSWAPPESPPPRPGLPGSLDFSRLLNAQQLEAVLSPPGPSLVIAGAGSGKTRTLTYRVARLLDQGISAHNILLLTFTNKAAREMLERVAQATPYNTSRLWGGTFHAVGNRMLRRHASLAGLDPAFTILDREDQHSAIRAALRESGIPEQRLKQKLFPKPQVIASILSIARNLELDLSEVIARRSPHLASSLDDLQLVVTRYEERKRDSRCVDFDDLLVLTVALLEENPAILELYQEQFQAILVDEFQDTNPVQSRFVDLLAAKRRNLMVVGDDAQSIYSWRGADFRNILQFPTRYPGCRIYRIETNYRSTPEILRLANASIARNSRQFEKHLESVRPALASTPAIVALSDPAAQADFICNRVRQLQDGGVSLNQIAVLYRAHFHSMEIQMALERYGVPFRVTSGLRFFDQAHIKDVSAFMRLIVNPRDEVSFLRLVRMVPRIGETGASRLWRSWKERVSQGAAPPAVLPSTILLNLMPPKLSAESWKQLAYTLDELVCNGAPVPPGTMIQSIVNGFYEEFLRTEFANSQRRAEDIEQFARYAAAFDSTEKLLSDLSLLSSTDDEENAHQKERREEVVLSTVHQAKGLEWDAVFVVWLTEGMFPNQRALMENGDADGDEGDGSSAMEEERRLFYVAATRARDHLFLTYPRLWPGSRSGEVRQIASPFLIELPKSAYEEWKVETHF